MAANGLATPSSSRHPASTFPQSQTSQHHSNNNTVSTRGIFQNGYWLCDCTPRLTALKFQTKKSGPNFGRWFFRCPSVLDQRKSSCGLFLWEDANATLIREAEYWEKHPEAEKHAPLNTGPLPALTPTAKRIFQMPPTPETQRKIPEYYNTPNHPASTAPFVGADTITPPDSPTNRIGKKRGKPETSKIKLDGNKKKGSRRGRVRSRATTYDSNDSSADEAEAEYQRFGIQTSRKRRRVDGRESIRDKGTRYQFEKNKGEETISPDESYGSESDEEVLIEVANVNRQLFPTSSSSTALSRPNPSHASSQARPQVAGRTNPPNSKNDDSVFLTPPRPNVQTSSTAPVHINCTPTRRQPNPPPSTAPALLPSQAFNFQPSSTPLPPPGGHEKAILKLFQKHKTYLSPALRDDLLKELRRHERVLRAHITGKNFVRGMLREKEREVTDLKVKAEVAGVTGSFENTALVSEVEEEYSGSELGDGSSASTSVTGIITRESTVATTGARGEEDREDDDVWSSYGGAGRRLPHLF